MSLGTEKGPERNEKYGKIVMVIERRLESKRKRDRNERRDDEMRPRIGRATLEDLWEH